MNRHNKTAAQTPAKAVLKKLLCASVIGALGVIAAPSQAAIITFDAVQNVVTPQLGAGDTVYNTGDTFTEAGFTLQAQNHVEVDPAEVGLVGALVDSDNAFACVITGCPVGNGSNYYAGLNDGSLYITNTSRGVAGFRVAGLSYAFVAPVNGLPDGSYGQLRLSGITRAGATISTSADFAGQNNNGRFIFSQSALDYAFATTILTSLTVNACLFDGMGACLTARADTQNQAQFALDDVNLAEVPEPASYALMLLGVAGLVASRRRAK